MLHVPLDLKNNLTIDALVHSITYVSAIAQNELDTIKEQTSNKILKIDDPSNFQIRKGNGP